MLSLTSPNRSYLLGVASSLATAWVVIALVAGLIRNPFVYRLVAVSAWTIAALSILGLLQPTMTALDSIGVVIGGLRVTPLLVIKTSVLLMLTLWAANAASDFLDRRVRNTADLTPSIQVLIGKLIRLLLITFAIVIALSTVGIDFSALAFFSGAVGVGLGFGLQKIVSNLVSGIILLADKSIKPGDVISVGDSFGWVDTMGARYTSVVTRDGREFLIPNEDFVTQRVINWSYSNDQVRLDVEFGVTYAATRTRCSELAVEAAHRMERVLTTPAPVCHAQGIRRHPRSNFDLALLDPRSGRRRHQCAQQGAAGAVGYASSARHSKSPIRCATYASAKPTIRCAAGSGQIAISVVTGAAAAETLRRLAARQEFAHAVERLQDVLGRVGVGQPHIALAENAEVRPADDGDAGIVQQRRRQRLRLPAGALDVGEGVERALRRRAGHAGQFVEALDHDFAALVEFGDHLRAPRPADP